MKIIINGVEIETEREKLEPQKAPACHPPCRCYCFECICLPLDEKNQ